MKKQKGLIDILAAIALACAIGYVVATLHRGANSVELEQHAEEAGTANAQR
jgi:hypothetical protein